MDFRITLLICSLLLISSDVEAQDRVRLTNGEWAPYLSEQLPHHGAASHIVKEAFLAAGIETQYGFFPWKRSYKLAKEGRWHGTVVWVHTDERAKDFYYSDVVITDAEYLFHLKQTDLKWKTVLDLKGLSIGATLHTVYPSLERAERDGILRIERAGNYDTLYRRLLNHRIDAIPQVNQVGRYYLRTTLSPRDREKITYAETVLEKRHYHLIISRHGVGDKKYIRRFNRGLDIIRSNGTYDAIVSALSRGEYDTPEERKNK